MEPLPLAYMRLTLKNCLLRVAYTDRVPQLASRSDVREAARRPCYGPSAGDGDRPGMATSGERQRAATELFKERSEWPGPRDGDARGSRRRQRRRAGRRRRQRTTGDGSLEEGDEVGIPGPSHRYRSIPGGGPEAFKFMNLNFNLNLNLTRGVTKAPPINYCAKAITACKS